MRSTLCTLTVLAAAAATTLATLGTVHADAPAEPVDVRPFKLSRGTDVDLPRVVGKRTIVDGDVRLRLDEPILRFVGAAGRGYVAVLGTGRGEDARVARVRHDGSVKTIAPNSPRSLTLSSDGTKIAFIGRSGPTSTTVTVKSSRGGPVQARKRVRAIVSTLDLTGSHVVMSTRSRAQTLLWDLTSNRNRTLVRKTAYLINAEADRFAYYTRDPYRGGCTRVVAISAADTTLAKRCDQRVEAFSNDGERMATVDILSDGLGPTEIQLRATRGRLLAKYTALLFGEIRWETNTALLMQTFGSTRTTTARCVERDCEAATDSRPYTMP